MLQVYPLSLLAAVLLSLHGYRKGSLSTSGAVAAFFIGYLTLACPVKVFGFTLLSFYLIGSRVTKIGHAIKAKLEREYDLGEEKQSSRGNSSSNGNGSNSKRSSTSSSSNSAHKASSGGKRNWVQVCCNGLGGALSAVAFRYYYWDHWQNGYAWCLLKSSRPSITSFLGFHFQHETASLLPRSLFLFMLGHFACCMGDTLASETGILAKKHPRLILPPFRHVPPGTNGGLSVQGTLGSLIGGTIIGIISASTLLILDNPACQHQRLGNAFLQIVALGAGAGLVGSGIDSLLGATLQCTYYSRRTKQVLLGRLPPGADMTDWQKITGRDVLSNNAVNMLSSLSTSLLTVAIGSKMFQ